MQVDVVLLTLFVGIACSSDPEESDSPSSDGTLGGSSGGETGGSSSGGVDSAGGSDGSTGGSTGGTTGSVGTGPSEGCGTAVEGPTQQWVEQTPVDVDNREWRWWAWFPQDYDPSRAYPLVVLFHGCGDETNNVPIEDHSGQDAILVRARSAEQDSCWFDGTLPGASVFDEMVESIGASACVDRDEIFAVGYDSGAWLVGRLSCHRAYRLKGFATVAGGNALSSQVSCGAPAAAMLIHDQDDMVDPIEGSEALRDRLVGQNFCVTDGIPNAVEPSPCVSYSGCGEPVVWCSTSGKGHDRQDDFAAPAIWDFFSGL